MSTGPNFDAIRSFIIQNEGVPLLDEGIDVSQFYGSILVTVPEWYCEGEPQKQVIYTKWSTEWYHDGEPLEQMKYTKWSTGIEPKDPSESLHKENLDNTTTLETERKKDTNFPSFQCITNDERLNGVDEKIDGVEGRLECRITTMVDKIEQIDEQLAKILNCWLLCHLHQCYLHRKGSDGT